MRVISSPASRVVSYPVSSPKDSLQRRYAGDCLRPLGRGVRDGPAINAFDGIYSPAPSNCPGTTPPPKHDAGRRGNQSLHPDGGQCHREENSSTAAYAAHIFSKTMCIPRDQYDAHTSRPRKRSTTRRADIGEQWFDDARHVNIRAQQSARTMSSSATSREPFLRYDSPA